MANTFNGMVFTNIARVGFKAWLKKLAPLGMFSTDLSADVVKQGTSVQTRIVPVSADAVDLQDTSTGGSGDRESSNIIADVSTTAITVNLNQQPIAGFTITDEDAAKIGAGVMADTQDKVIETKAYAVANTILKYCFELLTVSDFNSPAEVIIAVGDYDMDDVVDAGTVAAQTGWGSDKLFLGLDPAYLGALRKDNAIQDFSASGISVVRDGKIPRLDRFGVVELPTLVDASTYGGSEDLRGFTCHPSALAIAMRVVESQATHRLEHFEVMTDPDSGATLVFRAWYVAGKGKMFMTFESQFGASKALTTSMRRIVAA